MKGYLQSRLLEITKNKVNQNPLPYNHLLDIMAEDNTYILLFSERKISCWFFEVALGRFSSQLYFPGNRFSCFNGLLWSRKSTNPYEALAERNHSHSDYSTYSLYFYGQICRDRGFCCCGGNGNVQLLELDFIFCNGNKSRSPPHPISEVEGMRIYYLALALFTVNIAIQMVTLTGLFPLYHINAQTG